MQEDRNAERLDYADFAGSRLAVLRGRSGPGEDACVEILGCFA